MPYARFDDRYDDHKKIKRAWRKAPAAVGLHAMAITYCNRHISDGEVDADWIEEKLAMLPLKSRERRAVLDTALALNMLERIDADTFLVHDFLDWNLSKDQRSALAEQGRKGGKGGKGKEGPSDSDPNGSSPPGSDRSSLGLSEGQSEGSSLGLSHPGVNGLSTPRHATPIQENSTVGQGSDGAASSKDVRLVFDAWIEATGRTGRTVFDVKRQRLIKRSLGLGFDADDLCDAVRGWKNSPHHRGENDAGTIYNDLDLLLRDAAHIEKFRDLARRPLSLVRGPGGQETTGEIAARRGWA